MFHLLWLSLGHALAGPGPFDHTRICASEDRVVLAPEVHRALRASSCPAVVPAQDVADFLKAFALRSRELADPGNAERLLRTVDARWLLVRDGSDYRAFDRETEAFVDLSPFHANQPRTPTEEAWLAGYRALKAKRYDDAATKLTECIELSPEHVGCHWELGWVHWVAEDWAATVQRWETVHELQPEHPDVGTWLPKAQAKAAAP